MLESDFQSVYFEKAKLEFSVTLTHAWVHCGSHNRLL